MDSSDCAEIAAHRKMILLLLATLALLVWVYLFFAHAGFWLVRRYAIPMRIPGEQPSVAVIVPARNEAGLIGRAVASLLTQDYYGTLRVFIVDDNSTDDTAKEALGAAQTSDRSEAVDVISGTSLPRGWSGKVWAMQQGWNAARAFSPEYVLFTDADIEHAPGALGMLVAQAQSGPYDLVSLMVRLRTETLAEKLLIPAFVYFFWLLYPPSRTSNRRSRVAGAAGGCMLIRTQLLEAIGGLEPIRNEIIDDCALAAALKAAGGRLWLGTTCETRSLRGYDGLANLRDMIARTAFNQLRHSVWLLLGCVAGMLLAFVVPIVLLGSARRVVLMEAIAALGLMTVSYLPVIRFYRLGAIYVMTLPLAALFYLYATLYSAAKYWMGKGGEWKGRIQDQ
jgi:hopene-associated glycosyltransferase HpnB